MKAIILIAAIAATMTLMSCSKNADNTLNECESTLNVKTNFENVSTRATISSFPAQSAIGLFVTRGSLGSNYNNFAGNTNVKSVFNGSIWTQTPEVYLSPANATVYAYYPYVSSNINGTVIPIEHLSQTDYMFGTHSSGQTAVNSSNPNVNLTMKHALSLLQFKFAKANYTGPGIVTKLEICNKSGKTALCSEGVLNIATGTITYTPSKNEPVVLNASYSIPTTVSALVLPVVSSISNGDILLNFTIDGKNYTTQVPSATKWEQGKINTYTVTLNGTGLVVNNVSIIDWITGTNGSVVLQ